MGGLIKFPHENLREVKIEGDGLDGGGGGQEETDVIKQYIDKLEFDNTIPLGIRLRSVMSKTKYESIPLDIPDENKIGNYENFDYVLADYSDAPEEPDDSYIPTYVFMNNEQFQYYNSKFIRNSLKDFIVSSLSIDDIETIFNVTINDEDDIKNLLAIDRNDFTFGFKKEASLQLNNIELVLDDIDISILTSNDVENFYIIFDENETRKIFDVAVTPLSENANNKYSYLEVQRKSTNYIEDTIQIGDKNYKYLKYDGSIAS